MSPMLHEHTSPCRHLFDTPILGRDGETVTKEQLIELQSDPRLEVLKLKAEL